VIAAAAFELPSVICRFFDVAVMGQAVEQRSGHLCIA
jgi:hypothetical protein